MTAYPIRRERQEKHEKNARLIHCLAGPLRRYLPDSWIREAGGTAERNTAFNPLVMVWCMLRQSQYPDPACRATLAWLQAARTRVELPPLSSDTGGYCKARQRLPEKLLGKLANRVAGELVGRATGEKLWCGRRVLIADGSAFSMPDTGKNQARYPQPGSQRKGCGFPVAGFVALICLATGALLDAALGTCTAHDLALFYYVRSRFCPGDVFLGDRGFASYAEMALFRARGVDSVLRLHQNRQADFKRGKVIGVDDHVVAWPRPRQAPKGLRAEDFALLPETLQVREIRYRVSVRGWRASEIVLSTTLLDAGRYPAEALAVLYFRRWRIEVDFRHLKTTLQLDVCRSKSPEVVDKEFWAHVLSYNLIRAAMWESGEAFDGDALGLSFKGALQHLLSRWVLYWCEEVCDDHDLLLAFIDSEFLPYRPGRVEPRVRKRRPKNYSLMTEPRHILKEKLPLYHY